MAASWDQPEKLGSTAAPKALDLRQLARKMREDLPANWIHRGERHTKGVEPNQIKPCAHNKSSRRTGINSLRLEDGVRLARCQRIVAKMQKQALKEVAIAKEADQELTFNEDVEGILMDSKTTALMEMNLHLSFASRPKMLADAMFSWQGNLEWSKLDEDEEGLPGGPFEWPHYLKNMETSLKQEVQKNQSALKIKLAHVDDMRPGLKKNKAMAEWEQVSEKLQRRKKDLMGVLRYETKKWLREDASRRRLLEMEQMTPDAREEFLWSIAVETELEARDKAVELTSLPREDECRWWAVTEKRTADIEADRAGRAAVAATMAAHGEDGSMLACMDKDDRAVTLSAMSPEQRAGSIQNMPAEEQPALLAVMSSKEAGEALTALSAQAAELLLGPTGDGGEEAAEEAAKVMETMVQAMTSMEPSQMVNAMLNMPEENRAKALLKMDPAECVAAMSRMPPDDIAATISTVKAEDRVTMLLGLEVKLRAKAMLDMRVKISAECLLQFPEVDKMATLMQMEPYERAEQLIIGMKNNAGERAATLTAMQPTSCADTILEMKKDGLPNFKTLDEAVRTAVLIAMAPEDCAKLLLQMKVETDRVTEMVAMPIPSRVEALMEMESTDMIKTLVGFPPEDNAATMAVLPPAGRAPVVLAMEIPVRSKALAAMSGRMRADTIAAMYDDSPVIPTEDEEPKAVDERADSLLGLDGDCRAETLALMKSPDAASMLITMDDDIMVKCLLDMTRSPRAAILLEMVLGDRKKALLLMAGEELYERTKTIMVFEQPQRLEIVVAMNIRERVETLVALPRKATAELLTLMTPPMREQTLKAMDPGMAKAMLKAVSKDLPQLETQGALASFSLGQMLPQDRAHALLKLESAARKLSMEAIEVKGAVPVYGMAASFDCMTEMEDTSLLDCLLILEAEFRGHCIMAMKSPTVPYHVMSAMDRYLTLAPQSTDNRRTVLLDMADQDLGDTLMVMTEPHRLEMMALLSDDDRARAMMTMSEEHMEAFTKCMTPEMKAACLERVKIAGFRMAQIQKLPRTPKLPQHGNAHPASQWQAAITQEKKSKEENRRAMLKHKATLSGISVTEYEKKLKQDKLAKRSKK